MLDGGAFQSITTPPSIYGGFMDNKFIEVLTYDENCIENITIVNIDSISHLEIKDYYEEEEAMGLLFFKNGREALVREEGLKPLQDILLGKTIGKASKKKAIKCLENINFILSPNNNWNKTIGIGERMSILHSLTKEYKEEIAEKIKLMSYPDFLKTPYWKAISIYMKIRAKKCELCGSKFELHTHHKTYEHHGYEMLHLNDLQVLCGLCHYEHHKEKK